MDFLFSLGIVILVSALYGVLWNLLGERFYLKSVLIRYWGAIGFGILGGIIGFYYLSTIVNFLVIGTNINFVAVILGASIALWIATKINPENK